MTGRRDFGKIGYGFRNRILFILSMIEFATILFFTVFFSHYIKDVSIEMMTEKAENRSQQLLELFSRKFALIDNRMDSFILNEYVQKSLLSAPMEPLEEEMVLRALLLVAEYSDYYLYLDNKQNVYSQRIFQGDVTEVRELMTGVLGSDYAKTKLVWLRDTLFDEGKIYLFACRYVRPVNQNHEPGILILRLNLDLVKGEPEIIGDVPGSYYIINDENKICLVYGETEESVKGKYETVIQPALEKESKTGIKNGIDSQNGLVCICDNEDNHYRIVSQIPYSVLMETYHHALAAVIVVFIGIMLMLFLVSLRISDWFAKPIRQINHYMTDFNEKRMDEYLSLHTNTELDSIGESYNLMIDKIGKLMEEVKNREEELRKSEMNSLLYQINPHFLYNTLDVIYMLARMNHESEIMQMIEALTKLLRINLSNGADTVTIEEELTYIKAYMDILKIRNDNLFVYEVDCEERLSDRMVIKLLLQPLVENSIKHGFRHMDAGGRIVVRVSGRDGRIQFLVKNNGGLIPMEKIESINRLTEMPIEELGRNERKRSGYGLANIIKRLRLYYHDDVEFYFAQEEGYTVCHISIPMKEGEDERV